MATTTRTRIVTSAEQVFDHHGFAATGVDRLTEAAGVSTRTLYKRVGSKAGLVAAVLEARSARFLERLDVESVDALFAALKDWTAAEGAHGCLFLRAQGEDGASVPGVAPAVDAYRTQLRALMHRVVALERGHRDDELADQVLVLFEGATSAATYLGADAIASARRAAASLLRAR